MIITTGLDGKFCFFKKDTSLINQQNIQSIDKDQLIIQEEGETV